MAIEVRDVTKRFGAFTALHDVSIDVQDGALMALLGPSGSGKSTLLRVIAGLEEPDAGSVAIGGQDLTDAPARTRGVGFVFQHYAPFKHMTVHDNVAFGLTVRKAPKREVDARVRELLSLVRLDGLAARYPSQLSGGQLQRMALARALAPEPSVLLLDEPFGALDVQVRAELREWLRRLHEEIHVTTIFVTHDQEEAMDVAAQIVVMNGGRIEQTGTPRELYEHPANEFVMSFVGPVNRLGDALLRPHDIQILRGGSDLYSEESTVEALVRRVAHLGFEVRVELTLPDGRDVWAQVTRETAAELELAEGQILAARLPAPRVFA
ncbi:MAG TPA: TOBE-like domain-containing protein [Solirubrobacteraceae bacterium]|nr:TOBE-like domain-containing protein [Solirubrobacteraceae bacterium]